MKRDKVELLLTLVREQVEEFLEQEELVNQLSPEEILIASVELVTSQPVTRIARGSPMGKVDRDEVRFVIEDFMDIRLAGEDTDEED